VLLSPVWRVNSGPDRPGGWTGPDLLKDRPGQLPGQTRATQRVYHDDGDLGEPGREPVFLLFFSNVGFETY
jgi:hypothetical protein